MRQPHGSAHTAGAWSLSPPIWIPGPARRFPLDQPRWCGPGPGAAAADSAAGLDARPDRHRDAQPVALPGSVPLADRDPITLGEGCTPLIRAPIAGAPVLLKCEWFNPTCSFKDRGASVMLSLLRAQGIDHVLEDSSGNGGAAVAAYAAAGGMAATILTPASTSPAKTVQMRAHGATVELIPGTRQDTADAAMARSDSIFYASHNWHPFFLQGTKTLAYELWEDLGFRAAGQHHHPVRRRIERAGLRDRLFGTAARRRDRGDAADLRRPAGQLRADRRRVHRGRRRSGADRDHPDHRRRDRHRPADPAARGAGHAARNPRRRGDTDRDGNRRGHAGSGAIGIYVEPTSAQAAAAFGKLLETGTITPEQTTVLVMTGTGLKATPRIAECWRGSLLGMRRCDARPTCRASHRPAGLFHRMQPVRPGRHRSRFSRHAP